MVLQLMRKDKKQLCSKVENALHQMYVNVIFKIFKVILDHFY